MDVRWTKFDRKSDIFISINCEIINKKIAQIANLATIPNDQIIKIELIFIYEQLIVEKFSA